MNTTTTTANTTQKFNIFGEGQFYGVFTANDATEARKMAERWATYHRMQSFDVTPNDPLIHWIEPRANAFLNQFRTPDLGPVWHNQGPYEFPLA